MLRRAALVTTDVLEELSASLWIIVFLRSMRRLLVTSNIVSSSPILVTLMIEALPSSEISVLIRTTGHNISEDGILHGFHCENLKSYIELTGWAL
jgi:hypothetical protein